MNKLLRMNTIQFKGDDHSVCTTRARF